MPIDRCALVTRHDPVFTRHDPQEALQVGNGELAFTADVTGLQTFSQEHQQGMRLGFQAQWGWHSFPNAKSFAREQTLADYGGVPYASRQDTDAGAYLRANPHRLHLGRLGFVGFGVEEISEIQQRLRLWEGRIESRFSAGGQRISVETLVHPTRDLLAVHVESAQSLTLRLRFPGPSDSWGGDGAGPDYGETQWASGRGRHDFTRTLDDTRIFVALGVSVGVTVAPDGPHAFQLSLPPGAHELTLAPSPDARPARLPRFSSVREATARHWAHFWSRGGALEIPGSPALERRVVLSQYLTAIQCAGSLPPQETGLSESSWFGKFHLEMHLWHAAPFALWGREKLLERSLPFYEKILPLARETARRQGFSGARWPKMVGPDGHDSPSGVGVFLLWQQPHPIYFAELLFRARPRRSILEKYKTLVFESAEFLASFAKSGALGPALIPAQESYKPETTQNPTFELAYAFWALSVAQEWRRRLGLSPKPEWERVKNALPRPTVLENGTYAAIGSAPFLNTRDHTAHVGALGLVPPIPLIQPETMRRTLDAIDRDWQWETCWGWDFPLLALTAARLGDGERAVSYLLKDSPKNRYLACGHNYQTPRLPLYLPGNGGLLLAAAHLAASGLFPARLGAKSENLHTLP